MEDLKKLIDGLQKSVKSIETRMDSLTAGEASALGAKSPGERLPPAPTWADRIEETEA